MPCLVIFSGFGEMNKGSVGSGNRPHVDINVKTSDKTLGSNIDARPPPWRECRYFRFAKDVVYSHCEEQETTLAKATTRSR